MKKILFILMLLTYGSATAQFKNLFVKELPYGSGTDSLVVWDGFTKELKYLPSSILTNSSMTVYSDISEVPGKSGWYALDVDNSGVLSNIRNIYSGEYKELVEISEEVFYIHRVDWYNEYLDGFTDYYYDSKGIFVGVDDFYNRPFDVAVSNGSSLTPNHYTVLNGITNFETGYAWYMFELTSDSYVNNYIIVPTGLSLSENNITIDEAELSVGETSIRNSEFEIGFLSKNDTIANNILVIKDLSGRLSKEKEVPFISLKLTWNTGGSYPGIEASYLPLTDRTGRGNVINLDDNQAHSEQVNNWFSECYSDFTGTLFYTYSGGLDDTYFNNNQKWNQAMVDNEIDLAFSANTVYGQSLYLNDELFPGDAFRVVPLGSNSLIQFNRTQSSSEFMNNGVYVTSRAETDDDGTDPTGTSYGFGVEFNEPTDTSTMDSNGYTTTSTSTNHQQSIATPLVAAKLKWIRDETDVPWWVVREAARKTASNADSYNIYRGFGVIDTSAAKSWIETNYKTNLSADLARQYDIISPMPEGIDWNEKTAKSIVQKSDINDNFLDVTGNVSQTVNGHKTFLDGNKLSFGTAGLSDISASSGNTSIQLNSGNFIIKDGMWQNRFTFNRTSGSLSMQGGVIVNTSKLSTDAMTVDSNNNSWGLKIRSNGLNDSGLRFSSNSPVIELKNASGTITTTVDSDGDSYFNTAAGNFGIGNDTPGYKLDVNGTAQATQYKLSALNTAPSSASDTGTTGEIRITSDYVYVCIATNTWVRAALSTW